ncbi:MAG: site-specific integrase [Candidatus Methylomirabilota bacterium]|jgi:integrase
MARKDGKDRGIFFRARPNGEVIGPKGQRGEWYVRYWTADGREKREKAGTKSMALDLYRRRKTEVRQGIHFPETMRQRDARLKDLVADHLEALRASHVKTANGIERRLINLVGILGNVEAKTIKAADLERLKIKLVTGTRTPTRKASTINHHLEDLKAVFHRAMKTGKLDRDPFVAVGLLPLNNKRARELSPEEEFRLFQTVQGKPPALRPYFRFLLETGARAGEACKLKWPHILWADGMAELPETKAGKKQYLTLSQAALTILRGLPHSGPYVFCWPDGRAFRVDFTTRAFLGAARRAGIPNLRQHDLRHAFAIRRLRGGANLVAVSALLRHASTKMSERYLHIARADLRAAVEAGQPHPTGTRTGTEVEALLQDVDSQGVR